MKATVNPVDQRSNVNYWSTCSEVDKGIKQAVKRIASQVNIPGFRKGHAPRRILEMNFGKDAIMEEAFEVWLAKTTVLHFIENDIVPVSEPEIEREQFEEGKDLIFKATVTKRPEVKLGDYKGLRSWKTRCYSNWWTNRRTIEQHPWTTSKMVVAEEGATIQKTTSQ